MKQIIKIEIECGEHTCASEFGKFCRYLGSTNHGSTPLCFLLYDKTHKRGQTYTVLTEIEGWTQRCPQCKSLTQ